MSGGAAAGLRAAVPLPSAGGPGSSTASPRSIADSIPPASSLRGIPHTAAVQTGHGQTGRVAWVAGLVLTLSPFMDWYASTSAERADALGHRLAYRGPRQARLLHRARDADPRSVTRSRDRAPRLGAGSVRPHRARRARVDLRPRPPRVDPGYVLRRRRARDRRVRRALAALGLVAAGLLRLAEAVPVSYVGRIAFALSTRSSRSKPLPTKPRAPLEVAWRSSVSSTWPLNMRTGIEPTP